MEKYKFYYAENSELSMKLLNKIVDYNLRDRFYLIRLDNYLKQKKKMPKLITTIPSVLFSEDDNVYEVRSNDINLLLDDLSKENMKETLKTVKNNNRSSSNWLDQARNIKPGDIKDPKDLLIENNISNPKQSEEDVKEKMDAIKRKREMMDEKLKNMHKSNPMTPEDLNKLFDKK